MLQRLKVTSSIALSALFLLVTAHQSNASTQSEQSITPTNFKHGYLPNYTVNSIESEQTGIKLANGWGRFKNKRKHYCERKRRGRLPQSRSCRSYRARHAAKARAKFFKRMRAMQKRKSLKLKRSRKSSSSRARTTNNSGGAAAQARIAQLEKDLAASRSKEQAMANAARELTASKARIAQLEAQVAASAATEARVVELEAQVAGSPGTRRCTNDSVQNQNPRMIHPGTLPHHLAEQSEHEEDKKCYTREEIKLVRTCTSNRNNTCRFTHALNIDLDKADRERDRFDIRR